MRNSELDRKRGAHDIFTNRYELEFFPPKGSDKAPFVIICPGGGYQFVASCIEGEPIARRFNELGFAAFVLRYRVRRKGRFPAPQEDIARALREILEQPDHWNVEPNGYAVCGFSAGGHLAAGFGTEQFGYVKYGLPKPGALILCYPVITMGEHTHAGSLKNLLGKAPSPQQIETVSIEKQVTSAYPATFVWNSQEDETVEPCNSQMLVDALERMGVPCEYVRYQTGAHGIGLGIGTECEGWIDRAAAFWQTQRKNVEGSI